MSYSISRAVGVIAFATIATVIGACGGDDGGSTGPGPSNGDSRFTARIDGAAWASEAGVERVGVPVTVPGIYVLTGAKLGAGAFTIVISLYNIPGPGTYPLGVGVSVPGGNALISSTAGGWKTAQSGADGTIEITTLTATRMEGRFSFTAVAFTGGATGTKTVTDGQFVLEIKPTGTIGPLPDNVGSKMSATLNGTAYNAAEVVGSYAGVNGILAVVGNNNTRSMSITLSGIPATGVGTYALTNASPARQIGVSVVNGTQVTSLHHSSAAGSSGSVIITSFTPTRIKGTFTGTLGAVTGTGTVTITNGSFDFGRLQ
jgi:hypothetical protein